MSALSPRRLINRGGPLYAQRVEELVWQSKYLLFGVGFLLFLIYELAHFGKFLAKNWAGY